MAMTRQELWEQFLTTGNPQAYMRYKDACKKKRTDADI